jgi:glycosyltransferase involved in cell wall biosynthesis
MRVLMLTTDLRMGGVERTIINRAECLRAIDAKCAIAGLFEGPGGPGRAREVLEAEGFPVFCAGVDRLTRLGGFRRLRRFAIDWQPEVVHAHLFHGHLAAAVLRLSGVRAPAVWSYHAIAPMAWPVRRAFYRFFRHAAAAHVYVSDAVMRYQHAAGGTGRREQVIHNGTDLRPFLALAPRPGPVIGAVGRLVPRHKGFDVLIKAFARLAGEDDDARLRIAGDGPERRPLEELVRAEGVADRVEFAGFVSDVPGFLATVNVFANPSRWEAFGNTLVEGMAAGLPCVASRIHGLPEIGGEFVRWVEPEDVDGLHRALRDIMSSPPTPDLLARQREHVKTGFSRERMARDYLDVYRSVLRGP